MALPSTIHDLPTPALLLDAKTLERNITTMAEKVRRLGARLRPHIKTHKCLEIGRQQLRYGAQGVTVSTIVEARDFADGGFDDITWAFPLPASRVDEALALAQRVTLRLLVDSAAAADALEIAAKKAGIKPHVWLEVDCGYHRSGVLPDRPEATDLARRLAESDTLVFDGLLTHAGHSYGKNEVERRKVAEEERSVTAGFADALREQRITVPDVSIGSTPSMAVMESLAGVTEARPGNYVFNDFMQVAAGVCQPADVAVSVLATVISHQSYLPHCIVDAGALAMSKDTGPGLRGLGPVYRALTGDELEQDVSLSHVSQEHGFVEGQSYSAVAGRFRVGDRLRIMPNHSCLTAAMFDHYWVVDGESIVDQLPILRGR